MKHPNTAITAATILSLRLGDWLLTSIRIPRQYYALKSIDRVLLRAFFVVLRISAIVKNASAITLVRNVFAG